MTVTCNSTTHKERFVALSLQEWLRERATTLRYTCIVCIVPAGMKVAPPSQPFGRRTVTAMNANMAPGQLEFTARFPRRGTQ